MQSKSNLSHRPGDLNNVQLTETKDIHNPRCIVSDITYWW